MAFSDQFLDELRARAGLADVIGRRVRLQRKGREHLGLCPFHKEKTPSFTVNQEKGFYHCFGCGAHGSVFDFVMETEGLSFPEAVEKLAGEAGLEVPRDTPEEQERQRQRQTLYDVTEKAAAFFERHLRMPDGRRALDYLKGRGLDDAAIARFRLGFAPDSRGQLKVALTKDGVPEGLLLAAGLVIRPQAGAGDTPASAPGDGERASYDRFRGRVIFPITDARGRIIAFGGRILGSGEPKYLNSPETSLFRKGEVLYGLKFASGPARKAGTMIVTEGYMDVIALHRAGFENAVAPLGTALTEEQMRMLWRIVPEPVLCFDGDAAGQMAAARAAERALPLLKSGLSLRFALLPEGEDPDTLIRSAGAKAMAEVVERAVALSEVLWRMETGGRVPATPEERAGLQKRMKDYARRITDPTLRAHFASLFNDRVWAESRRDRRKGGWTPSMVLDHKAGPAARIDAAARAQRVLLATLINHPQIFDGVEETLGKLSFAEARLDQLRQELISLLLKDAHLETEGIKRVLRERGFAESLDVLFRDPLIRTNRVIKSGAPAETVKPLWNENVALLKHLESAPEVARIKDPAGAGISEQDWEQVKALIAETMPGHRE
jgi:DNA primase